MDCYLYLMLCSGPSCGSLQGAMERMSKETNVGGLLSCGSGEVWICCKSVGLGLEQRSSVSGLTQHSFLGGRPGETHRKENSGKNGAHSKV